MWWAIEYVFNTIQTRCQMDVHGVKNVLERVEKNGGISGDMLSFKIYFMHVDFPNN